MMRAAACLLALLLSYDASATLVTIAANDYAQGDVISAPGIGISTWELVDGQIVASDNVRAQMCDHVYCEQGTQQFVTDEMGLLPWYEVHHVALCFTQGMCDSWTGKSLVFEFDGLTDYVQVAGSFWNDPVSMWAVGANNDLIGSCILYRWQSDPCGLVTFDSGSPFSASSGVMTLQFADAAVSRLFVGGYSASASVHSLTYNQVPEPSTFALLGGSLLLFFLRRRKTAL